MLTPWFVETGRVFEGRREWVEAGFGAVWEESAGGVGMRSRVRRETGEVVKDTSEEGSQASSAQAVAARKGRKGGMVVGERVVAVKKRSG